MARKQESAVKDLYEEAYGPMQVIYITEAAQKRLNGDESFGKWYERCRYSNSPTTKFCIKTTVPESALENRFFHPDRFEPDIVAEMCEKVSLKDIVHRKVSPKKIAHQADNGKPEARFKKGMKVRKTFYGTGGYTEIDEDIVESVKNGVVRTVDCGNGITFNARTGKELENFFPGMRKEIIPLDELAKSDSKKSKKSK